MGEIVQFVSRSTAAAEKNLEAFVSLARDKLTAFAEGGAWDEVKWRNERVSVVFCKYRPRNEARRRPVRLAEPFLSFAKAYFRYRYSHKPVTSVATMLDALRMIELALIEATGGADIRDLNVPVLQLSVRFCEAYKNNETARYLSGRQIEAVADFCREHALVAGLPGWKSPFRKQRDLTVDLTEEGTQHRESRLPTNVQMLALADLFATANDVESRYFTAIAAMMMFAPNRVSEVLALPLNCKECERDDATGETHMYLRWRAAKGGGVMKKRVPAVMQSVVLEAVRRLTSIGAAAREAARFAHENPGRFMRHPLCLTPANWDEDAALSQAKVAAAIGLKSTTAPPWSRLPPTWAKHAGDGPVTYAMLAEATAKLYTGAHWPYINAKKEVVAWEALCLVRESEYDKVKSVRPFSWKLPGAGEINDRLGRRKEFSLFERAGLRNGDGSPIKLTTHQLRHWLSTMAMRAGMDDYTLARWAGRARIDDNRHYDHRTDRERNEELHALLRNDAPSTLEKFRGGLPVTYRELGVDRPGTAKATLYGMCTHDYAVTPCAKRQQCMRCKEHVCIKGEHVTLERIKALEQMLADLVEEANRAVAANVFGADRWRDSHGWELALVRTMRKRLEDEAVPDGTILAIPGEYDPSPVRRTLMELNVIEPPSLDDIPVTTVVPRLGAPIVA